MAAKFVDGNELKGYAYDVKVINKLYKSLNCPKGFFDPSQLPLDRCAWMVAMSVRANTGKTTNILLWALCAWKLEGIKTCYVRQRDYMIAAKQVRDMYNVIVDAGYIRKLFGDEYNNVRYFGGAFYLVHVDEEGNIDKEQNEPFCRVFSVQSHLTYKSTTNDPKNDIVVFDEFVSDMYYEDEFVMLNDLLSTLFRMRESGWVFMLANTLDKNNMYIHELCIAEDVAHMEPGDSKIVTSPLGTNVYVTLLKMGELQAKLKESQTRRFFGFPNPKLASITGATTWAIKNYQRIPKGLEIAREIPINRVIQYYGQLVRIRLVYNEKIGYMLLFTKATRIKDGTIIYTVDDIDSKYKRYRLGDSRADKLIWKLWINNKAYYGTNEVGTTVERYINMVKEKRK